MACFSVVDAGPAMTDSSFNGISMAHFSDLLKGQKNCGWQLMDAITPGTSRETSSARCFSGLAQVCAHLHPLTISE